MTGLAGVTKISAGFAFSLALRSDGTVWAWGYNISGQLGTGTTADSAIPVKITGLSHVTSISAGYDSSVATATNGISAPVSVWTWGGNKHGELGDGTLTYHTTPERVTGLPVYIAGATVGFEYAAVLGTDGSVWAWGADGRGQLGNGPASTPATRPVNTIGTGSGITQISAGSASMLALKSDGTVLAWGGNEAGELGTGTTTSVTGPVQVTGLTGATQVASGAAAGFAVQVPPLVLPPLVVPDLSDDTTTQAGQVLQAAGLVLGTVTKVTDKYCDHRGTVMSQTRPPGPWPVLAPRSRSRSASPRRPMPVNARRHTDWHSRETLAHMTYHQRERSLGTAREAGIGTPQTTSVAVHGKPTVTLTARPARTPSAIRPWTSQRIDPQ